MKKPTQKGSKKDIHAKTPQFFPLQSSSSTLPSPLLSLAENYEERYGRFDKIIFKASNQLSIL